VFVQIRNEPCIAGEAEIRQRVGSFTQVLVVRSPIQRDGFYDHLF
jgi:hypothetical protein